MLPRILLLLILVPVLALATDEHNDASAQPKTVAYLVSDIRIPFWKIMSQGIRHQAKELGYELLIFSAQNQAKIELQNTIQAIRHNVDGIIVSPTNSSACVTILELAQQANIPVTIADIGAEKGHYVSYISSDNQQGAYDLGKLLTAKMYQLNWQEGSVGVIAIPQSRENGKARTAGFIKALDKAGIKGAGIVQQINFSYQETYDFTRELIDKHKDLKALWLQGSDRYQAALDAIKDSDKQGDILLLTFDAEPEFLKMIPEQRLLAAAMQQPFLMGEKSVLALNAYLHGQTISKNIKLPVLAVSAENIHSLLPLIKRNVLGQFIETD